MTATSSNTITAIGGTAVWTNPYGKILTLVQVSGNAGDEVVFEEFAAGSTWFQVNLVIQDSTARTTGDLVLTSAATLLLWRGCGTRSLRVRGVGVTGTITVSFFDTGFTGQENLLASLGNDFASFVPGVPGTSPISGIPIP